jgi:hypothetical protein
MRVLLAALLTFAATFAHAAPVTNVAAWNVQQPNVYSIAVRDCPPLVATSECVPNANGIPDTNSIIGLRDGDVHVLRFQATSALFLSACTDITTCAAAVDATCTTLGDTAFTAKVRTGNACAGVCVDGVPRSVRNVHMGCTDDGN